MEPQPHDVQAEKNDRSNYSSKRSRSKSSSRSRRSESSRDRRQRSNSRESDKSRDNRRGDKNFTTIYVKGLNPDVQENHFEEYFADSGEIDSVKVPRDPNTNKSRGFGFITFKSGESAQKALEKYNDSTFEGNQLIV